MRTLLTAAFVVGAAAAAVAQDPYRAKGKAYDEFEIDARFSFLGGDAIAGTEWSDFYSGGVGFKAGLNHLWATSDTVDWGLSASFTYDRLLGDEYQEFDSGSGETLSFFPDDLNVFKLQAGGILRIHFAPAWLDIRFAFGAAYYTSADVELISPSVSGTFEGIASTFTYCFDLSFRLGFDVSPSSAISIGLAFDMVAAPDAGSGFVAGTEFDYQDNAVLLIGGDYRF